MLAEQQVFPWQSMHWQVLIELYQQNKLPHAILLQGQQGLAKGIFANRFIKTLLCEQISEQGVACGRCRSCHLLQAKTHPDLFLLSSDEDNPVIKVDMVRELRQLLQQSSSVTNKQVVLVESIDAMNSAAINAFLKTVEEPKDNVYFLLVSHQFTLLPATLRSRCQSFTFYCHAHSHEAIQWLCDQGFDEHKSQAALQQVNGAVLMALKLLQTEDALSLEDVLKDMIALMLDNDNPLVISERWRHADFEQLLDILQHNIMDILLWQATPTRFEWLEQDKKEKLDQLAKRLQQKKLLACVSLIQQHKRAYWQVNSINKNFILDELALQLSNVI